MYKTWKHFVDSLVLLKVDYCKIIFQGLLKYPKQRIYEFILAQAGFMKCKCNEVSHVADPNWLLVEERVDFRIIKFVLTD